MKYYCVDRYLSAAFSHLGRTISRRPVWFIFVPLLTAGLLSFGLFRICLLLDIEYVMTPIGGRSLSDRAAIESLFHPDRKIQGDLSRMTRIPKYGSVIIVPKDEGSILRESILNEVILLDSLIQNLTIDLENLTFRYSDICLKLHNGQCFRNEGLSLRGNISKMNRGELKIKYPIDVDPVAFRTPMYILNLGGVTTNDEGYVEKVKAFKLSYIINNSREALAKKWEKLFLDELSDVHFDKISVYKFAGISFEEEISKVVKSIYPQLVIAFCIMTIFGAVSCMTLDWTTSKPWIGVASAVSSVVGVVSAFGFLQIFGTEYVDINIAVPFLMLGIGMDDSFVILAAWRQTDSKHEVEERLSAAYSEAALPITITTITNFLASCIGLSTPYRLIRIFSLYMAVSIIFVYLSEITFFGGCVALSGYREKQNRHAVFCIPVKQNQNKGILFRLLMEGCPSPPTGVSLTRNVLSKSNFYEALGKFLSINIVKATLVLAFGVCFVGATVFLQQLTVKFDYKSLITYNSYAKDFYNYHYKYFSEYSHPIQIVINKTLDYSDPEVQYNIGEIMNGFYNMSNIAGPELTESWLKSYLQFIHSDISWFSLEGYNISNSEDFISGFRDVFLKFRWARRFQNDVIFSEDGKNILASRFIIYCKFTNDSSIEYDVMNALYKVADSNIYQAYIYNAFFVFLNVNSDLLATTIQCLYVSAILVIVVFILFIPNATTVFCVVFTIVAIEIEVMGYMVIWGVHLNVVSMIGLLLVVGFCVDYSAHLSYAYVSCEESDPNLKLQSSLYKVGYPITQGCISTILGIAVLPFCQSEAFILVFKVIFLVIILSFCNAIILLPVVLSLRDTLYSHIKNLRHKPVENNNPECAALGEQINEISNCQE